MNSRYYEQYYELIIKVKNEYEIWVSIMFDYKRLSKEFLITDDTILINFDFIPCLRRD